MTSILKTEQKSKWGIDSNILIYALNQDAVYFRRIELFFHEALEVKTPLYTTVQNVLEAERMMKHLRV